jgi:hypothetical protein
MMFRKIIPIGVAILGAGLIAPSALAQQQPSGVQGALQGLLSGNQSQDQAVRDAYERGYHRGRQDGARMARSTRNNQPNEDDGSADRSGSGSDRDYRSSGTSLNYDR